MSVSKKISQNIYQLKANNILKKYKKALNENNTNEALELIIGIEKYWGTCLNDISANYRGTLQNICLERINYGEQQLTFYDINIKKCLMLALNNNNSEVFNGIISNTTSIYNEDIDLNTSPKHFEYYQAIINSQKMIAKQIKNHNFHLTNNIIKENNNNAHHSILDIFSYYFDKDYLFDDEIINYFFTYNILQEEIKNIILLDKTRPNTISLITSKALENNTINKNNFLDYTLQIYSTLHEKTIEKNEYYHFFNQIIKFIFKEDTKEIKDIITTEIEALNKTNKEEQENKIHTQIKTSIDLYLLQKYIDVNQNPSKPSKKL